MSYIASVYPMQRQWELDPDTEAPESIEGPIKPVRWSAKQVQLTDDGGGSGLMIDLDPAEGGTVGQVIVHSRDDGPVRVLAASWGDLLREIADDAEAGRYVYGKKGDSWGLVDGE